MLLAMIREILATDSDCDVVAEIDDRGSLATSLKNTGADLVILALGTNAVGYGHFAELLEDHPKTRVLAIATNGRRAFIHELRPFVTEISELSPQTLLAAVRQTSFQRQQAGSTNG
jgi:DNA-binding NarL/FixJ family response regulator